MSVPRRARRPCLLLAMVMLAATSAAACRGPESTRLRVEDFDLVVAEMRASLARFLTARGPDAPPMRILTVGLRNESSDVLTKAEKWMAVARVQSALPIQELARVHGVTFQMPLHQVDALRAAGYDLAPAQDPTHEFTAVLRSTTRSGRLDGGDTDVRKDTYEFSYEILSLATRELVWSDSVLFAREARGTVVQ